MIKLELKEFQKKILADENDKIIVNMSRGGGRTFLCLLKMIKEQPKLCFYINGITPGTTSRKVVTRLLKEFDNFKDEYGLKKDFGIHKINYDIQNYIQINYKNGQETKLYFDNCDNIRNTYDLVLMDNMLLQSDIVKGNKYFSTINISGHIKYILGNRKDISIHEIGLKELYENNLYNKNDIINSKECLNKLGFNSEIDLFCEYDELFKEENNNKVTYDDLIDKFINELNEIPSQSNTTMYRMNLIQMITELRKLK